MNPYKILNIERKADKREVIRAASSALRERRFSAREIALAQKELLDPTCRSVHEFLHFLDVGTLEVRSSPKKTLKQPPSDLKRLSIFDEDS